MTDPWERVNQGFEYWAYSRGANDRRQGREFNPGYGGPTPGEQQLYTDGWNDQEKGRERDEAIRRWPEFVLASSR